MKLMVLAPDGETIIPVTEKNIVGLSDTLDFLITKRKMIAGELQQVMSKLSSLKKESATESEQLSFLQSESMIDIFDKKIASVPMNAIAIEREIKRLEKTLKAIRQEISAKTKSDSGIIKSLYDNMVRFATALDVGNSESIASSYLFTSNLKELSGAVLHKTVFAFRLAYIIEIQKKLGFKLPLIKLLPVHLYAYRRHQVSLPDRAAHAAVPSPALVPVPAGPCLVPFSAALEMWSPRGRLLARSA